MSKHAARARSGLDRASLYDEITNKVIAELEAGRVPWVQPWSTAAGRVPLGLPKDGATGRLYPGINVLILWGTGIEHSFLSPSWLTFRQALSLGGNVRKGEHGTTVVYAHRFVPDDEKRRAAETGDAPQPIPFLILPFSMCRSARACPRKLPSRGRRRSPASSNQPSRP